MDDGDGLCGGDGGVGGGLGGGGDGATQVLLIVSHELAGPVTVPLHSVFLSERRSSHLKT